MIFTIKIIKNYYFKILMFYMLYVKVNNKLTMKMIENKYYYVNYITKK
jgi:hypothetical protein